MIGMTKRDEWLIDQQVTHQNELIVQLMTQKLLQAHIAYLLQTPLPCFLISFELFKVFLS